MMFRRNVTERKDKMYYPEELIEEVRTKSDIVDVISGYVRMQKKGSNYFGLCPFHNEKISFLLGISFQADFLLLRMRGRRQCDHLSDGI